jgi:hypothetical protein
MLEPPAPKWGFGWLQCTNIIQIRTLKLNERGYKVIRYNNEEVLNDIHSVLDKIKNEINQYSNSGNENFESKMNNTIAH